MRRPESHRTGELGEIHAIRTFTEAGWIVEKLQPDYGFDLLIQRTESEVVFGDFALIQVKATRHSRRPKNGYAASVLIDHQHLELWRKIAMPTFLLFVILPGADMFVLDCRALLNLLGIGDGGSKQKRYKVAIPDAARVSVERMRDLASIVQRFWSELRLRLERRPLSGAAQYLDVASMSFVSWVNSYSKVLSFPGMDAIIAWLKNQDMLGYRGYQNRFGYLREKEWIEGIVLLSQLRNELSAVMGKEVAERVIRDAIESSAPGEVVAPNKRPQPDV